LMAACSSTLLMASQPRRWQSSQSPFSELKSCVCRKELQVDNKTFNDFLKELYYEYNILDYKYSNVFQTLTSMVYKLWYKDTYYFCFPVTYIHTHIHSVDP
jgi:hypothetical protein